MARLLERDEYEIKGLDITSTKIFKYLNHPHFKFDTVDVHDSEQVLLHIESCDTVISLVALCNPSQYNTIPLEVIDINFVGPLELVKMCVSAGKRLIHFSTSEVYGKTVQGIVGDGLSNPDDPAHYILTEDDSPLIMGPIRAQRWTYAAAKQLLERVIYAYGSEGKLDYTIVRPLNFVGARMDYIPGIDGEGTPRVLACFMDALMFNKPLQVVDGGHARRTFTAISDAIDAIIKIIDRPEQARNQIFHIGNPKNECSMRELAELMIELYKEIRVEHRSRDFSIEAVSSEEFYGEGYEDCDRRVPDISKAQELLDWNPEVGLKDSMRIAVTSFIKQYGDKKKRLNGSKKARTSLASAE